MKDSYYFKHDYNARNDPKIVALRRKFKGEGIAVFWVLTEILHEIDIHHLQQKEYLFETISEQSGVDLENVKTIINFSINEIELFKVDEIGIFSERVNLNILGRTELSERRAIAGSKGGKSKTNLVVIANQSEATTKQSEAIANQSEATTKQSEAMKEKEMKEKEMKEKEMKEKEIKEKEIKGEKKKDSESKRENLSPTTNLEDFGKIFIEEKQWLDDRAVQMGCSISALSQYAKEFMRTNLKIGKQWDSKEDIHRHFISWVELQPKFGNLKRLEQIK